METETIEQEMTEPEITENKGGPKTSDGKRIASRNATTHGLFARDIVLPSLGEDPEGFEAFLKELADQIKPTNLLEQHYVEKIAAASWRLRRLHRWEAQLFDDSSTTEDQIMLKLDRVMRHETALQRQIDSSVKMLEKHVVNLHDGRARRQALLDYGSSEYYCRKSQKTDIRVTYEAGELLPERPISPEFDHSKLDNNPEQHEICKNELQSENINRECEELETIETPTETSITEEARASLMAKLNISPEQMKAFEDWYNEEEEPYDAKEERKLWRDEHIREIDQEEARRQRRPVFSSGSYRNYGRSY